MRVSQKPVGLALSTATPREWERIRDLFEKVLGRTPGERDALLDEHCAGEPRLRDKIEKLLGEYGKVESQVESTITCSMPPGQPVGSGRVTFAAGESLCNRFCILRLLGTGGMGEVYEAQDLVLGERVALKTIRCETAADQRAFARFVGEVHAAQKIAHPNVCRIHDIHEHQPEADAPAIHFLTMELLQGETLSTHLRRSGALNMTEALAIAEQLCAALSAAHRAGVVHRDFKSANVILATSPDGLPRAVVTDFGLAHSPRTDAGTQSITMEGQCVGTPAYMAPEQVLGGSITPAIDIYALGIVLYEMVTGAHPFAAASRFAVMMKRLQVEPPSPKALRPELPPQWESAILRCLEREPQDRFSDASAVWDAITERGIRVGHRRIAGAVTLAVLLSACAAGALIFGRHHPSAEALRWYEEGTRAIRDGTYYTGMQALSRAVESDPQFTLAHARLAEAASELDYGERARSEMAKAEPSSMERLLLPAAERIRLKALLCAVKRDYACAAGRYQELLNVVAESEKAAVLVDLGSAYEKGEDNARAIASYTQSAALNGHFAAAFLRRGIVYGRKQERARAEADLLAAENLYRTLGKTDGLSEVLYQRCLILRRLGDPSAGRPLAEEVLRMALASGDEYHQIRALLALSHIENTRGDTTAGRRWAEQAVAVARRSGEDVLVANTLAEVGNTLYLKGENQAAEVYLRDAMQMANRQQAWHTEARAAVALAGVLSKSGARTEEALAIARRAQELFDRAGYRHEAVMSLINVGRMIRDRGDLHGAAALFESLIPVAQQTNDPLSLAHAENGLGSVLLRQEQYPAALRHFDASLSYYETASYKVGLAFSLVDRAGALAALGRYGDATAALDKAEAAAQPLRNKDLPGRIRNVRAGMIVSRRLPPFAEEMIGQLRTSTPDAQNSRLAGVLSLLLGRTGEALDWCTDSVRLAQAEGDAALLRQARLAVVEAQIAAGKSGAGASAAALASEFAASEEIDSAWRSLAFGVLGSRDTRQAAKLRLEAVGALERLRQAWGPEDFAGYESRPDVQWLKQRLSRVFRVNSHSLKEATHVEDSIAKEVRNHD